MNFLPILGDLLRRFRACCSGNIAMFTSLSIVPIIVLACGAIDVVLMVTAKQRLQAAFDSATLAAASLTNTNDPEETIEDYIKSNLPDSGLYDNLEVNIEIEEGNLNSKLVTVTGELMVDMNFLGLAGMKQAKITASSSAHQSATNIEIAMVLDISSSMSGNKLTSLVQASQDFIDLVLRDENKDYTSVSLIPFGGTVNLGDTLFNRYVNTAGGTTLENPSKDDYFIKKEVPYKNFTFTNGDTCIEYQDEDFDLEDIPLNSRPQVPHFVRYRANNYWCPRPSTAAMFNSNDAAALKARIAAMQLSDGTGLDIGAMWGAKALSPEMRGLVGGNFTDRPADFDEEESVKIVVIMTDGEITGQFRPRHPDPTKLTDIRNGKSPRQTIASAGSPNTDSETKDNASAYFKRVCEEMKDENIVVYTIGFQIKEGKNSDKLLSYCASSTSKYYFVEGLDLLDAFNSIAASVNSLRIVG